MVRDDGQMDTHPQTLLILKYKERIRNIDFKQQASLNTNSLAMVGFLLFTDNLSCIYAQRTRISDGHPNKEC